MPGISNQVGYLLAGFGFAWIACIVGAVLRVMYKLMAGGSGGDVGM